MGRSVLLVVPALLCLALVAQAQTDQLEAQRRLRHAESLERAGQYDEALAELETLLNDWPSLPNAVLAYERVCRRQGRLEYALPVVRRAVERDPGSALLREVELRVLVDMGAAEEVRATGERWLRASPGSEVAYRGYAEALARLGDAERAESVLELGIERAERPEVLYAAQSDLYISQRRWPSLAASWFDLLRSSPGAGWDLITYELESMGRDAALAAEAVLQAVANSGSASPRERELAAIAALYAGRQEEARSRAESVLVELDSSRRRYFINQFAKVAADQRYSDLMAWTNRQMLRDAASDTVRWSLARMIIGYDLTAGDTTAALETLDEMLDRTESGQPAHRWASATQVRLFAAQDDGRRAQRALQRHARLYPQDDEVPLLALSVAEANLRSGRLDEAKQAMDLVPEGAASGAVLARLSAGRAYLALYAGRFDQARSGFEIAAAMLTGEGRAEALRLLAILRSGSEAELRALATAQRARVEGHQREAVERLLDGLERTPASAARPALLLWAGEVALGAGAIERAEEVLRHIPRVYPNSGEAPVALVTLAEGLAAQGRASEAIALLETLIIEYPNSALTPLGRRRLAELREEVPRS